MSASPLTIYKASAGSGKTFTIAAEYIALLLEGGPGSHRHILAVTFTNKATGEMKERILSSLEKLAYPERGDDPDFRKAVRQRLTRRLTDEELRREALRALGELLHDYDFFRVETIDSFFQWLLANLAHELGLSANFKIDLNENLMIEKAVDRLLRDVDANDGLRRWIIGYIKERIGDNRPWDIRGELRNMATQLQREAYQLNEELINESLHKADIEKLRRTFRLEVERLEQQLTKAAVDTDHFIAGEDGKGYEDFSNLNRCVGAYLRKLAGGDFSEPTATVQAYMQRSPLDELDDEGTHCWLKKGNKKAWPELAPRGEEIRKALLGLEKMRADGVPVIHTGRLVLSRFNALCMLRDIADMMERIAAENNHFLLAKTPKLFYDLVEDSDAPFVFEKAGTTFHHILIDEFQDTSRLQWLNFKKLLVNGIASGRHNMLVGDVKQSIYRFRGGDFRILHHIGSEVPHLHPQFVPLDTNYRSAREVIAFNNAFFPEAARLMEPDTDNPATAAEAAPDGDYSAEGVLRSIYTPEGVHQNFNRKAGGRVWVEQVVGEVDNGDGPAAAAASAGDRHTTSQPVEERLYEAISHLHAEGLPYHKMAILVRRKKEATRILTCFAEQYPEVPLTSAEAYLLSAAPSVHCLIYALHYLKDPSHAIAREYLYRQYAATVEGGSVVEEKQWEAGSKDLPPALQQEMEALRGVPLYECCERLIALFRLHENSADAPYLLAFLDQVLAYLEDYPSDLGTFLRYWDESLQTTAIQGGSAGGVSILTIHKSKGLDFHTVFLPYCDWQTEDDRVEDLVWARTKCQPFDCLPMVPVPTKSKYIRQSDFAPRYEEEHRQQRIENINLLYVAFTRAQYNLYIWYSVKSMRTGGKTMGHIIDESLASDEVAACIACDFLPTRAEVLASLGTARSTSAEAGGGEVLVGLECLSPKAQFRQSNPSLDFTALAEESTAGTVGAYIDRGKLLHAILAEISTAADIERAVLKQSLSGLLPADEAAEKIIADLRTALQQVESYGWFDGRSHLRNECEILFPTDDNAAGVGMVRPDRVMLREDAADEVPDGENRQPSTTVVIVDYKFGHYHGPDTSIGDNYARQVQHYASRLREMGYARVEGYLWFVDAGKVTPVC